MNRQQSAGFLSESGWTEFLIHFTGGALGGTAGTAITCPLEVVKTRLQSSHGHEMRRQVQLERLQRWTSSSTSSTSSATTAASSSTATAPRFALCRRLLHQSVIFRSFHSVWREGRLRALYKGLGPNLVGVAPSKDRPEQRREKQANAEGESAKGLAEAKARKAKRQRDGQMAERQNWSTQREKRRVAKWQMPKLVKARRERAKARGAKWRSAKIGQIQRHRGGRGTVYGRFVVGGRVDWLVEPGQAGGRQQTDGVAGQNIEQFGPGQAGGGHQMEGVVAGQNIEQFVPFC
ncbi:hypothetical protein niasHT_028432 [Heterodera trifolii]|uniref:Mitochondrial carrier protein n=1 Tax=Heterodera trifolii TaxID=157864 RepID=A0ABD2JKP4_9BILA